MSLVFFASHAHLDRDKDLREFVRRLREAVRANVGLPVPAETVGFFDETQIETADDWEKVLSEALRKAKVCVCLYSPTYAASRFCGKEYQVFLQRRDTWLKQPGHEAKRARVLFCILWVRPPGPLPAVVEKFQYTDAKLPEDYEKRGLRYLAQRPGKAAFRKIIEELGMEIRDALLDTELPPEAKLPQFNDIPSAFHDAAYGFRLAVLHPDGAGWAPYPGGGTLRKLAETLAGELKVSWGDLSGQADLVATIRKAEKDREAVIVVCDAAGLGTDPPRRGLVEQLSKETMRNFVLLFVWTPPAATAEKRARELEKAIPGIVSRTTQAPAPHELIALDSFGALAEKVEQCFAQLRQALVAQDPALKADDPAVRAAAQSAGIPVDSRPSITGPGASR